MRARLWGAVLAGVTGLVGAVCVSGCIERLDGCVNDRKLLEDARHEGRAGSRLTCMPVRFGEGGSGGGGGDIGRDCVPSENKEPVDDECGIFVSSSLGKDGNEGTKKNPVKKLSKALELAKAAGLPVFACGEPMVEEPTGIVVEGGMRIFGGLDCTAATPSTWVYKGEPKTEVSAPPDEVPMQLEKGSGTELHDLHVHAKAAVTPGRSSVAVIANEVTARFVRSTMLARDGARGVDGAPHQSPAMAGENGVTGASACTAPLVLGGLGPSNRCSIGGDGGNGSTNAGFTGTSGSPANGAPNFGLGETSTVVCTNGGDGQSGEPGPAGPDGSGLGTLDVEGHVGVSGQDGMPGTPGKGGGGGGGTKSIVNGMNQCPGGMNGGASGGSGASGGCGGAGGVGGTFGGSSIGMVSLGSVLTFEESKVIAGKGAEPGAGSQGQDGGQGGIMGGVGGFGSGVIKSGCNGGRGGKGGKGGRGGNGVGGHSIGIAYREPLGTPEPFLLTETEIKFDTAGTGGVATGIQMFE